MTVMAEAGYMLPSALLQRIGFVLQNIVDDADRKLYPLETPNANYPEAFATTLKIASVYLASGGYSADAVPEWSMKFKDTDVDALFSAAKSRARHPA